MRAFHFDLKKDAGNLVIVDFDDAMQVKFYPYPGFTLRPKLSHVVLWSFVAGKQLARYNVHTPDGGGKFCLVHGHSYAKELGQRWEEAHDLLNIDALPTTERLGVTDDDRIAWDCVKGSLPYARRLSRALPTAQP